MLRRLYDFVMRLAAGPQAELWLWIVGFAESSFFPVPPDAMLAPMVFARPERAYRFAGICTMASVLGALGGYAIGYFLTPLGLALLKLLGHADGLAQFQSWYDRFGVAVILIKGLTPIPFKLVTITSGLAHFNLGIFIAACIVTRGARFFIVAGLIKKFGPTIQPMIEKRLTLFFFIMIGLAALALFAVKLLH